MAHGNNYGGLEQIRRQRKSCQRSNGLPFSMLLTAEKVEDALRGLVGRVRKRIFTPSVTLWTFLSQLLSPDHSCRDAVLRLLAWRTACGLKPCSANTSSYCRARKRLPLELFQRLLQWIGRALHRQAEASWLWKGRSVKVADGTSVTMPDTPENQAAFPRRRNQKHGVGFPIARLVVIFSLACGAALKLALAPMRGKKTGETTLLRTLRNVLDPGDILLGDRLFSTYRDVAELKRRGVDVVFRQHASRHCDFRRGHWLSTLDHVVVWKRPKFDASRFDRVTYDALPAQMKIRELRFRIQQTGFRPNEIVLVTTLLGAQVY